MSVAAVIVAAGRGERLGGDIPKQYMNLLGQPVVAWSVRALAAAGVDQIVVAVEADRAETCRAVLQDGPRVQVVIGGATRTASVRAGLAAIDAADVIMVHDAARPGVNVAIIKALLDAIDRGMAGAAPALPVTDSLRRVDEQGVVVGEVEREWLMRVQTPQAFRASALRAAYEMLPDGASVSDDLAVVRAYGGACTLIPGDARLKKITYAEDLPLMEQLLGANRICCVGAGFDAHRFGQGDHVTLCGVRIEHDKGVIGHSDADVGWHALVDAILGALGEGDIGVHFPPSDPQWKGADSERFLRHAAELVAKTGARLAHVDITLICERPRIGPHREAMRVRTAEVLGLALSQVSVKATTTEGMGFCGRGEGLAAQAMATLERPQY